MLKKSIGNIVLGIVASIAVMALGFYFFLFANPFRIYEFNTLKWIPILICIISFYVSGWINRNTSYKLLPLLFIPFAVFDLFNFAYFPFIFVLALTAVLVLIVTRNEQKMEFKVVGWAGIAVVFLSFLFTQPLILAKDDFSYDDNGDLVNVMVLWDFTEKEETKLHSHILLDSNNQNFDMINIKGKIHFITFWATWCGPCIEEKPQLEKLKKSLADNPEIQFIDISFDDENSKWLKYLENKQPLGFQLISRDHQKTSRDYKFAGLPMHFIVNSEGVYKKYKSFEVAQKVLKKELDSSQ